MKYKINKNLLEENALQINWKTYTFKEVFNMLDEYVGGMDLPIYDEEGNEVDTWQDKWERFLHDEYPKTLADCIDEACEISGQNSFATIVGLTNDFPEHDKPNHLYEAEHKALKNKTFINPHKEVKTNE